MEVGDRVALPAAIASGLRVAPHTAVQAGGSQAWRSGPSCLFRVLVAPVILGLWPRASDLSLCRHTARPSVCASPFL